MSQRVTVKIDGNEAEIVVGPEWFDLDVDVQQRSWDKAVATAQKQGWFLVESLHPAADPRHCMHIDADGTEHHYLLRNDQ
jgi:hypothetical protein